jgi:6,7-dimethyl-8-ribityllumazine synthase
MNVPRRSKDRVAIVVARFNPEITARLSDLCRNELLKAGVAEKNIAVYAAPGAYELPFVARKVARTKRFDAVICFGCVIKGDTTHDVYVATWASVGIGQASLETGVPILYGVLTPKNEKQARDRAKPGPLNRGKELALSALEMIDFNREKL